MSGFIYKNNANSLIVGTLTAGATTLNVTASEGTNFPSTFPFRLTLWDATAQGDPGEDSGMEIVHCTGRTTDALTIVRGQEGTADVEHAAGEKVAMLWTAGHFNDPTYGIQTILDGWVDQSVKSGAAPALLGTNVTAIPSANINFNVLGTPTYETAQDWFNVIQTAGIISGFELSNSRSATELDVAAGTGIIKSTDSEIGSSLSFDFAGVQNVTLTGNNINYIYLDYNAGTPQIVATTDRTAIELNRHFNIGRVFKNGVTLHILNAGVHLPNLARNEHERLVERDGFTYASGAITSEIGTLNLDVTAGVWYLGHNRVTTDALDSSVADTWIYTHYGVASWITDNATVAAVDTTYYNDGTDVLASLGPNNYGVQWGYITTDSHWYIIYDTINGSLAVAQAATPPTSLPPYVTYMGELIAKIIHKQDGTIISIEMTQEVEFTATGVPNHNDIGAIQGGTASEYYHLTSAQHTIATQAASTTLSGYLSTADWDTFNNKAEANQTMYIGTTGVTINRASAALTLAGITLTTPDIGTPSAGTLTNCTFPTLNQNTTGSAATLTTSRTIGGVAFDGSANIVPNTITIADESSDTTCFLLFAIAATGEVQPKTASGLTFNSSTDILSATGFSGPLTGNVTGNITGNVTGNADTATALATARTIGGISFDGTGNIVPNTIAVVDESSDTTCNVAFFNAATGSMQPKTGTNLTFNSSTGILTATGFSGPLTGQADTVATIAGLAPNTATTQATQASITTCVNLVTVGTLNSGSISSGFGAIDIGASNISTTGNVNTGLMNITTDIVFTEAADHASTPAAGYGYLWVKSTAPSTLIFTDDAGTDTTLGSGGTSVVNIFLPAETAYLPATNPAVLTEVAGATTYVGWSYLAFDDSTAETAIWRVPIPDYDGGNIVVKAYIKPATTPDGTPDPVTVAFDILTLGVASGETWDTAVLTDEANESSAIDMSIALSTGNANTEMVIGSVTINPDNVSTDEVLLIGFKRNPTAEDVINDHLEGDAQLLGINIEYTRS